MECYRLQVVRIHCIARRAGFNTYNACENTPHTGPFLLSCNWFQPYLVSHTHTLSHKYPQFGVWTQQPTWHRLLFDSFSEVMPSSALLGILVHLVNLLLVVLLKLRPLELEGWRHQVIVHCTSTKKVTVTAVGPHCRDLNCVLCTRMRAQDATNS